MQDKALNYIIEELKRMNHRFKNGYIYNDKEDDGFLGITDFEHDYFYLRNITDDSAKNFFSEDDDTGTNNFSIQGTFYLVIDLFAKPNNKQANSILTTIVNQLVNIGFEKGFLIKWISAGDNSEAIYLDETGRDDWKQIDCNLYRVEFDLMTTNDCITDCLK